MRYDLLDATSKRSSERAGSSSVRGGACDAASGCGVAADGAERDRPGRSDIENGAMGGVVLILVVLMRLWMVGLSKLDEVAVEFAAQFID
jgi:hypothetical protein